MKGIRLMPGIAILLFLRFELRLDIQRRYLRRVLDAHWDDMNMSISRRKLESVFNR
jgi:hypothetical protein